VKLADISGIKREYLKENMKELGTHSNNHNITSLYKGIN
jgi:hypothetical protein